MRLLHGSTGTFGRGIREKTAPYGEETSDLSPRQLLSHVDENDGKNTRLLPVHRPQKHICCQI